MDHARAWDVICFIEHLCVANLVKLFMILCLCFMILMFFYLLFKVGICQCIVKSLCKLCWTACETYCFTLEDITYFFWHNLKNTKRVNRRRRRYGRHHQFRDIETGYSSTSSIESDCSDSYNSSASRKRSRTRKIHRHHKHHVKLNTRQVSLHLKSSSRISMNSRRLRKIIKGKDPRRQTRVMKRRRIR